MKQTENHTLLMALILKCTGTSQSARTNRKMLGEAQLQKTSPKFLKWSVKKLKKALEHYLCHNLLLISCCLSTLPQNQPKNFVLNNILPPPSCFPYILEHTLLAFMFGPNYFYFLLLCEARNKFNDSSYTCWEHAAVFLLQKKEILN